MSLGFHAIIPIFIESVQNEPRFAFRPTLQGALKNLRHWKINQVEQKGIASAKPAGMGSYGRGISDRSSSVECQRSDTLRCDDNGSGVASQPEHERLCGLRAQWNPKWRAVTFLQLLS